MTEYDYEGQEYSIKTRRIGQRPVTVDGIFSMGVRRYRYDVRYSPMSKMRTSSDSTSCLDRYCRGVSRSCLFC